MYNQNYPENPNLYPREYSQTQHSLPDGVGNTEKKTPQYVDYHVPVGQMTPQAAYGMIPEGVNDYRAAQFYAPSYPYGTAYDNRI